MPRFSIVIPTYNRARFLGRAIESALRQTHPDVEVIVSDNASTDDTERVVREFGDKVRYHRNETNLGMWGNFGLSPGLATGEYFSWLTDDDYIRDDFAARAIRALSASEDVQMYVCWAAYSPSVTSLRKWTSMHGPMIPIDWLSPEATLVDGLVFVPFSFFESQAMPPAVAFRTPAARAGVLDLVPDSLQYNEYIIATSVAARGRVAVDPWIGAIHISHDEQAHNLVGRDPVDMLNQKKAHARFCQRFMPGLPDRWRPLFREYLAKLPVESRFALINQAIHNEENREAFWSSAPPVVLEMRDIVLQSLPEAERNRLRWSYSPTSLADPKLMLRKVVPPRVWKALRGAHQAWKSSGS